MFTNFPVIFTAFDALKDPRRAGGNQQHALFEIVFIVICATVGGCQTWTDIELFAKKRIPLFSKYLKLANGIPSHDTIGRVLAALDTASFQACLMEWIDRLQLDLRGQGIHIDGKTVRRSFDAATNRKALHVVNAWCSGLKICLGQVATEEKSNEITAVPMLLELLDIKEAVVTLDAMNCQTNTLAKIVDKEADYVVTVKGNQKKLLDLIHETFEQLGEDNFRDPRCYSFQTQRETRGRVEERIVRVVAAPRELKESGRWPGIRTIGVVYRHREQAAAARTAKPIPEADTVTYFISSLLPRAKKIAGYVNTHWAVENGLHWSLDVTFTEDDSRIRKGNGPEVMAMIRRLALSIIKRDTSMPKRSLRQKRLVAGWDENALESIILGI